MIVPWEGAVPPCCLYGNLYFVGTIPASVHLIDTGAGLILLDTGFPQSLYLVLESIRKLGFDPGNIKYIINTHGHYDHLGATRALVEMTGAKTFLGRLDEGYATGELDLSLAAEMGFNFYKHERFQPDVLLDDGSVIELGNTRIRCKHTPGHTPGTMSFFFSVHGPDGDKTAGMFGGSGFNTLSCAYMKTSPLLTGMRRAMRQSIDALMHEKVDIHVGNHVANNDTVGRIRAVLAGNRNAFVDPTEWQRFLLEKQDELEMLEQEDPEQK